MPNLSEDMLKKHLKRENGIPISDMILRVLARINAKELEKVFIEYAPAGKDKTAHKAVHVVSAWTHSLGVCFGQVKTEENSF